LVYNVHMDIVKALTALKKLELKMQELYEFYNKTFSEDKEAAGFFFELSLEEKSHADLIAYQLRNIRQDRSKFNDVDFDIEPLKQFMGEVEAIISSEKPISLVDALKLSMDFECNALEYHCRTLIRKSNPELGELIDRLGSDDKLHYDKLRSLVRTVRSKR